MKGAVSFKGDAVEFRFYIGIYQSLFRSILARKIGQLS
jgi:hypothetical protein